jgi:hypothetical protein
MLARVTRPRFTWAGSLFLALFVCFGSPATASAAQDNRRLHIVLIVDTNAGQRGPDLRSGMEANLASLKKVINEVYNSDLEYCRNRLYLDVLRDDQVSPAGVLKFLAGLDVRPNDVVWVYYCGHGAWDPRLGHYLAMSGGDLSRNELRNTLNNRGPRAAIITTDCCSSVADFTFPSTVPSGPSLSAAGPGGGAARPRVFFELFYECEGIIDVTAATQGEYGWTNDATGGFFTQALVQYLRASPQSIRADGKEGPVSWQDFFLRVRAQTLATFHRAKEDSGPGDLIKQSRAQTPYAFRLGGWPTQYTRKVAFKNNTDRTISVWVRVYDRDNTTGQWAWYPGQDRSWRYEVGPGRTLRPGFNGLQLEANEFVYWGVSADEARLKWNEGRAAWRAAPKEGYKGRIGEFTLNLNPAPARTAGAAERAWESSPAAAARLRLGPLSDWAVDG